MRSFYTFCFTLFISLLMTIPCFAKDLVGLSKNNTTLVPFRIVAEALDAQVDYDQASKWITMTLGNQTVKLKANTTKTYINNREVRMSLSPVVVKGTTYVPMRFVGEALGGQVDYKDGIVTIRIGNSSKAWTLNTTPLADISTPSTNVARFETKVVHNRRLNLVTLDLTHPALTLGIATAHGKINEDNTFQSMINASGAKVAINGSYFSAYNNAMPLPYGTLMHDGHLLHISDTGATLGITADRQILVDVIKTRIHGSINDDEKTWVTYRMNRNTTDPSSFIIYTPEYKGKVPLHPGQHISVCKNGVITDVTSQSIEVPADGFLIVDYRGNFFKKGDRIHLTQEITTTYTDAKTWKDVDYLIGAGPSLVINGNASTDPKKEGFTEDKILTQVASRSFIGVTKDQKLVIGTTSASVSELKKIALTLGLQYAMCLDGGASSGLYYEGSFKTTPGRRLNNILYFRY